MQSFSGISIAAIMMLLTIHGLRGVEVGFDGTKLGAIALDFDGSERHFSGKTFQRHAISVADVGRSRDCYRSRPHEGRGPYHIEHALPSRG